MVFYTWDIIVSKMPIYLSSSLTEYLPIPLVEAIYREYQNDPNEYHIDTLRMFYLWCKKGCMISILKEYIFNSTFFSLEARSGIASYLLGLHCRRDRMSIDERVDIEDIRSAQIAERRKVSNKRRRSNKAIDRDTDTIKRIKHSIATSSLSEYHVDLVGSSTLNVDVLSICYSYLGFSDIWSIRRVCKCFYNLYCTYPFPILIRELTNDSIRILSLQLAHYAVDTSMDGASSILPYVRKNYLSVMEFKRIGKETLSINRMESIVKRVSPIFIALKDRIIIQSLTIPVGGNNICIVYPNLVGIFLVHALDLSYI